MEEPTDQKKTRDFMNVESFSQLPFIRPTPAVKEKGIRLFGIEFSGNEEENAGAHEECSEFTDSSNNRSITNGEKDTGKVGNSNNRRFECHYCCRNFPTSQALGGHQNAHKRERQQAKRVHLQSTAGGPFSDIYGSGGGSLIGYGHFVSSSSSSSSYPSWTSTSRVYRTHQNGISAYSHAPPTITGSPLGLWRVPPSPSSSNLQGGYSGTIFNGDRLSRNHQPLPLFAGVHQPSIIPGGSDSQSRYYDSKTRSVQDHVSLDLHL